MFAEDVTQFDYQFYQSRCKWGKVVVLPKYFYYLLPQESFEKNSNAKISLFRLKGRSISCKMRPKSLNSPSPSRDDSNFNI